MSMKQRLTRAFLNCPEITEVTLKKDAYDQLLLELQQIQRQPEPGPAFQTMEVLGRPVWPTMRLELVKEITDGHNEFVKLLVEQRDATKKV